MIDLGTERPVPLRAATNFYPRQKKGKKTHFSTLYRHATHGCQGIVLETVMCGGKRCTSHEAVTRFFERLSELDVRQRVGLSVASAKPSAADEAGRQLDALVFGRA